jgi:hypothetical protein
MNSCRSANLKPAIHKIEATAGAGNRSGLCFLESAFSLASVLDIVIKP